MPRADVSQDATRSGSSQIAFHATTRRAVLMPRARKRGSPNIASHCSLIPTVSPPPG